MAGANAFVDDPINVLVFGVLDVYTGL